MGEYRQLFWRCKGFLGRGRGGGKIFLGKRGVGIDRHPSKAASPKPPPGGQDRAPWAVRPLGRAPLAGWRAVAPTKPHKPRTGEAVPTYRVRCHRRPDGCWCAPGAIRPGAPSRSRPACPTQGARYPRGGCCGGDRGGGSRGRGAWPRGARLEQGQCVK